MIPFLQKKKLRLWKYGCEYHGCDSVSSLWKMPDPPLSSLVGPRHSQLCLGGAGSRGLVLLTHRHLHSCRSIVRRPRWTSDSHRLHCQEPPGASPPLPQRAGFPQGVAASERADPLQPFREHSCVGHSLAKGR